MLATARSASHMFKSRVSDTTGICTRDSRLERAVSWLLEDSARKEECNKILLHPLVVPTGFEPVHPGMKTQCVIPLHQDTIVG